MHSSSEPETVDLAHSPKSISQCEVCGSDDVESEFHGKYCSEFKDHLDENSCKICDKVFPDRNCAIAHFLIVHHSPMVVLDQAAMDWAENIASFDESNRSTESPM